MNKEQEPRWEKVSEDDYAEKLDSMLGMYSGALEAVKREIDQITYWRDERGHRISYYFCEDTQEMKWEHHEKEWGLLD